MRTRTLGFLLLLLLAFAIVPASAQDDVTLVVWDDFAREAESTMIETLNAQFMEANPGIVIQRETYATGDLTTVLPTALTESTGPDVAMINQGHANMGALVEAGLLLPLNDYADQYDWWSRYAAGLHARNSFSEDGAEFGVGNVYGVSNKAEVVGVYYWREDFEELGLEIPQTLDEFETVLAALKDAGKTPIMFGSLDGWPAIHTLGAIQHSFATVEEVDAFTFGTEGGTYDTEANLLGAQKFLEWIDAGYFPEGFEGLDHDNATLGGFINHEASTWIAGTWNAATIIPELGEEPIGFFLFPPAEEGQPPLNIGGVGLGYGIRATSEHPDEAAAYIDFITGSEAAQLLLENGFLPAAEVDTSALTEGTLTADMVNAWHTISSENAVGHYWDWTIADMAAYIQELIAGVTTPEDFIATVEADYTAEE
jgi:raffinose/stachyose/melibiose transport system substrate-binding protein